MQLTGETLHMITATVSAHVLNSSFPPCVRSPSLFRSSALFLWTKRSRPFSARSPARTLLCSAALVLVVWLCCTGPRSSAGSSAARRTQRPPAYPETCTHTHAKVMDYLDHVQANGEINFPRSKPQQADTSVCACFCILKCCFMIFTIFVP